MRSDVFALVGDVGVNIRNVCVRLCEGILREGQHGVVNRDPGAGG